MQQRRIITAAPDVMRAIDAARITTVRDGRVWSLGVAEQWNAGLPGRHVTSAACSATIRMAGL